MQGFSGIREDKVVRNQVRQIVGVLNSPAKILAVTIFWLCIPGATAILLGYVGAQLQSSEGAAVS